jgi:hypothetical protein
MAGNPVLGFLSVHPTGDGPHATVTKMLRLLGILALAWAAVNVIGSILQMAMGTAYLDTGAAAVNGASAIISIVFTVAITAALLFWITFTINAWTSNDPRGSTHALVIAILATVFGALGVLGALAGGFLIGAALFGSGVSVLATVVGVLGLLVSIGELYCGIMILTNRGKATAGTGRPAGATN